MECASGQADALSSCGQKESMLQTPNALRTSANACSRGSVRPFLTSAQPFSSSLSSCAAVMRPASRGCAGVIRACRFVASVMSRLLSDLCSWSVSRTRKGAIPCAVIMRLQCRRCKSKKRSTLKKDASYAVNICPDADHDLVKPPAALDGRRAHKKRGMPLNPGSSPLQRFLEKSCGLLSLDSFLSHMALADAVQHDQGNEERAQGAGKA